VGEGCCSGKGLGRRGGLQHCEQAAGAHRGGGVGGRQDRPERVTFLVCWVLWALGLRSWHKGNPLQHTQLLSLSSLQACSRSSLDARVCSTVNRPWGEANSTGW